jgi:transposase InsO family protein
MLSLIRWQERDFMPLVEKTIVDIREEMAVRALSGRETVAAVAETFGVSIPTVRLWRERYRELGRAGLSDRSHAPHTLPHKTDGSIEQMLVEERRRLQWGSKKILRVISDDHPELILPARSTVDGIFVRHGLVRHRPRRLKARSPFIRRYPASEPGELMTLDHKGQIRLRNGVDCFPLTICDRVSRFLLACEGLTSTSTAQAWPVIERVLREHGLPLAVQSDNGPPFGTPNGKFSTVSVRFMMLSVQPIFSRPGKPGDNGAHERMHRDLKREAMRPPSATMRDQQKRFDSFRETYNISRPHEGIDMKRPAQLFRGMPRPYPKRMPRPQYDLHLEKRKVSSSGEITWRNETIFISEALRGQTIGLEPIAGALLDVHFYDFVVGRIDEETSKFL